ncbi:hypothetical protein Pfo_012133 [Paulownia fortunei]|nr:hypothetical protein Pfo_012133 [Paulownia fortunei]
MSHNAKGKGSNSKLPPPPQQIDEPKTSTGDEHEKLEIPSETKLQSATGELTQENCPNDGGSDHLFISSPDARILERGSKRHLRSKNSEEKLMRAELQKQQTIYSSRTQKSKKKLMRERQKAREIYREALHNTRDTITLVAILIATFTYTAGVSPLAGRTAFRVFSVCNNVALFTSICVVLVMVSIIPFKRKALMRLLAIAHKAIWVAVSFMATAYVAAAAVIMQPPPQRRGMDWTTVFLLSICAGSLGIVFVGLGIMLVKHRVMKRKWRTQKARQRARQRAREKLVEKYSSEDDDSSTNSDMLITKDRGYHMYCL